MPGKRTFSDTRHHATKRARSSARRPFKSNVKQFVRGRRKGAARPMRSLSTGYRGTPNQYRFIRETRPTTIDMGTVGNGVSHIAGAGSNPNMAILEFPFFEMQNLPDFSDFSNLFANYKIDLIETILIPQWTANSQPPVNPMDGAWTVTSSTPNLMITRVNTKYVNNFSLAGTAEVQRDELAQIQKKSRSMYGTKKWLKINTSNPDIVDTIPNGAGGVNDVVKPSPWLSTKTAADQRFSMNDLMFADRIDGLDFQPGIWKYRMYHRVHFRTSFVG